MITWWIEHFSFVRTSVSLQLAIAIQMSVHRIARAPTFDISCTGTYYIRSDCDDDKCIVTLRDATNHLRFEKSSLRAIRARRMKTGMAKRWINSQNSRRKTWRIEAKINKTHWIEAKIKSQRLYYYDAIQSQSRKTHYNNTAIPIIQSTTYGVWPTIILSYLLHICIGNSCITVSIILFMWHGMAWHTPNTPVKW